VVSFGTSAPELSVNVLASLRGSTDIAIGNVLGSNIANVLLILGISSLVRPLSVGKGTVWKEIPLSLLAALVLAVLANDRPLDGAEASILTRTDGMVLLAFFLIFLYYTYSIATRIEGVEAHIPEKQYGSGRALLLVGLGLAGLTLGGQWIVDGALHLADTLKWSQAVVGLTIVAVGTSLPELATSAVAAYRGNVEIAVGNVVGSNIFNIFLVLGVSSILNPLRMQEGNNADIGVVVFSSLLLFAFMFTGSRRTLDRWEGGVFFVLYIGYIIFRVTLSSS
jgi:cation:H+ antiporter